MLVPLLKQLKATHETTISFYWFLNSHFEGFNHSSRVIRRRCSSRTLSQAEPNVSQGFIIYTNGQNFNHIALIKLHLLRWRLIETPARVGASYKRAWISFPIKYHFSLNPTLSGSLHDLSADSRMSV